MELLNIYQCLCDHTRLRILNLLRDGPLCVCHLQAVLRAPQVKVSKHLAYLRAHGLVEVRRNATWMIYRLPAQPSRELSANLACLQDCAQEDRAFRLDKLRLRKLKRRFEETSPICCAPRARPSKSTQPSIP